MPESASFCEVDAVNVLAVTLKRAEDGNGLIVRLVETEGKETQVQVTMPHLSILHAYETNLVEENQRLLSCAQHNVKVTVKPFAIVTLRLQANL